MNNDIARRSHAVLTRALTLEGAQRDEFIATQCADDPLLRSHVARLLTAVSKSGGFLETPVLQSGRITGHLPPAAVPEEIGGYRLVRVLGAGGMATVYEAEQQQPRRTVALKVMRYALLHTSARQRFQFETEVLARLRHPGVAQIYAAGTFEDGAGLSLPYFAMEFVPRAMTLTAYVHAHRLPLREVLRLFLDVCDAVQHGHQLGVIHRDIKPGNILISDEATERREDEGERGARPGTFRSDCTSGGRAGGPKIIDFGVARSVDPAHAGITRDSDLGRLVGTLNYMSPEQCSESAAVDIRCDVYALGVVLYELVAGRLPYDLSRVPLAQALHTITHESPPPVGRLVPEARGDLEAIVGLALEKEPQRRYPSVAALASDVRRYLSDRPIEARPATTLTQLRKFARRNRAAVGGVAAVFVTLVGGILATTYMTVVANDARRAAEVRERALEQVTAFQQAQLTRIDPQGMGRSMRELLGQAVSDSAGDPAAAESARGDFERLTRDVNFTTLALRTLDENLLRRSYDAISAQFAAQPLVRAGLLQRLAQTMGVLGLAQRALPIAQEALQLRRSILGDDHVDALESQYLVGSLLNALGRFDDAAALLRDLLDRSTRTLGPESDRTLLASSLLGGALRQGGDLDGAERIWRETLETQRRVFGPDNPATLRTLNNIGIIHAMRGQVAQAEACWREVLERRRASGVAPDEPGSARANLAMLLQDQGKLDEARPLLEEDLAEARHRSGDDHPDTLAALLNCASLLIELGELDAAERLQRECLARSQRVFGPNHRKTLRAMGALAAILRTADRADEAESLLRAALAAQRRMPGAGHPDTIESLVNLSELLCEAGQAAEAELLSAEALGHARRLSPGGDPLVVDCLLAHGAALTAAERPEEAEAVLREAADTAARVMGPEHRKTRAARERRDAMRQSSAPPPK